MSSNLTNHFTHLHCVELLLLEHGVDDVVLWLGKEHDNLSIDSTLFKPTNIKSINVLNDDIPGEYIALQVS